MMKNVKKKIEKKNTATAGRGACDQKHYIGENLPK